MTKQDSIIIFAQLDALSSSRRQPPLIIQEGQQAGGEPYRPQQGEEMTPDERVARMIALDGVDPSIINNEHFKVLTGRSWHSRIPIENMCDSIFDRERQKVWRLWDDTNKDDGKHKAPVSLAVGRAKTMEREVMYSACHFIDHQWKLHKIVVDACVLVPNMPYHRPILDVPEVRIGTDSVPEVEDAPLGTRFWSGDLRSDLFMMAWGILPSSEYETYQHDREMSARKSHSAKMKSQLAQAFADTFPVQNGLVSTTFVDQVLEPIARCLRWVFMGFRKSIHEELLGLQLTRQVRHRLHSELGLNPLSTYDKDWYRTYCALRILEHKGSPLIAQDQRLADLLINVFGAIYDAIQAISDPSSPTSNLCLPMLFKVREVLQSELDKNPNDYNLSPDAIPKPENITKCLRDAMRSLERVIQDTYLLWSIPLVLDPRFKLQNTHSLFQRWYGPDSAKATEMSSKVSAKLNELYSSYSYIGCPVSMDTDSAGTSKQAKPKTDLDKYLEASPVPNQEGFKILDWWEKNEYEHPVMAHMARGALAMPTCSRISSEQMAHIKSIIRGYSKQPFQPSHSQEEEEQEEKEPAADLSKKGKEPAAEEEEEEEANRVYWRRIFFGEEMKTTKTSMKKRKTDKKKRKSMRTA